MSEIRSLYCVCFVIMVLASSAAEAQQSGSARGFLRWDWESAPRYYAPPMHSYRVEPSWAPRWDGEAAGYERGQDRRGNAGLPRAKVDAPNTTYKPDTLEEFRASELCAVATASNVPRPPAATDLASSAICSYGSEVRLHVLPEVAKAIKAYYSANPQFIWNEGEQINANARDAIAALMKSDRFGLSPSDYSVASPADQQREGEEWIKALVRFEFGLSAAVLTYALDATRGRIDPNRISGYHDIPRKNVDSFRFSTILRKRSMPTHTWRSCIRPIANSKL